MKAKRVPTKVGDVILRADELQLYDKEEFCEKFNLTISKLNMWIFRYNFPVRKIGGRVYILLKDYSEWLDEHKVQAKRIF